MSFVNLMASDRWSEADLTRRTEALVRAEFSAEREDILNRKLSGALAGLYTLTAEEEVELAHFQAVVELARQAGIAARADVALLVAVFPVEAALLTLRQPVRDELDEAEAAARAEAQTVLDGAAPAVLDLAKLRNPVDEVSDALPA